MGAGFFVVNFSSDEDYDLELKRGPWLIYDHYLSVQPCKPEFELEEEVLSKITAWIRISKLPLDYMSWDHRSVGF